MKQIIIFLLIVIIAILGYNQYKKYKRFTFSEYEYKIPEEVNPNSADKALLLDYYEAVEYVNGYVITQWSSEDIDVRNPGDDDDEENAAVAEYRKRLAHVKFYESQLLNPSKKELKKELSEKEKRNELISKMFYSDPSGNTLRVGDKNALVYEIQRILIEMGDSIKHDGLFNTETLNALSAFEERNGLLADGKLDAITLDYLLR
jgi:murein L,D-transpeptidase YcbB/YkuD